MSSCRRQRDGIEGLLATAIWCSTTLHASDFWTARTHAALHLGEHYPAHPHPRPTAWIGPG